MKDRYTLQTYDMSCVVLDAGTYTLKDLEEIVDAMKYHNQRVTNIARDALNKMNKAAEDNGEQL